MKKFLAVLAIAGSLVACNNDSASADNAKDSLDSVASETKDVIDSSADATKEKIDSTVEVKKDSVEAVDSAKH